RSRSNGDLHSKLARESVAESLVEGGEAKIQIDGPDEVRGALHQCGQVRSGIVLRLVFLGLLARCALFCHLDVLRAGQGNCTNLSAGISAQYCSTWRELPHKAAAARFASGWSMGESVIPYGLPPKRTWLPAGGPGLSRGISPRHGVAASELRGYFRWSDRALRLAKLKLQEPGAGDGSVVNPCGREVPVLRCAQGLVGEVGAWARPVDGSLGDIAFRIDRDTDLHFEVASNGAKDLCWYVGQGLVGNQSLDDTALGGFGRWGWRRLRSWRWRWCGNSCRRGRWCRGGFRCRRLWRRRRNWRSRWCGNSCSRWRGRRVEFRYWRWRRGRR